MRTATTGQAVASDGNGVFRIADAEERSGWYETPDRRRAL
jgi:hypothetical protein